MGLAPIILKVTSFLNLSMQLQHTEKKTAQLLIKDITICPKK